MIFARAGASSSKELYGLRSDCKLAVRIAGGRFALSFDLDQSGFLPRALLEPLNGVSRCPASCGYEIAIESERGRKNGHGHRS